MNIIVFGAIGGTGWTVNVEAPVACHIVTAFAHDANKIALAENLIVVKGDVMNAVDIAPVFVGQDAVVVLWQFTKPLRHAAWGPSNGPKRTFMTSAAKGCNEPTLTECCGVNYGD
jgi:putative NADH-flavin reductase